MSNDREQIERRLIEIREELAGLGPILVGTLLKKHNRKKRKDGSTYVSPTYYTLQYKNAEGRRCWQRIPRGKKSTVEKMLEAGRTYAQLESEYARLSTELALRFPLKKTP